jgi:hypothetical protein
MTSSDMDEGLFSVLHYVFLDDIDYFVAMEKMLFHTLHELHLHD